MAEQGAIWRSISDAFHRAQSLYLRTNAADDDLQSRATNYLIRRLASGMMKARARYYNFGIEYLFDPNEKASCEVVPLDPDGTIPIRFWLLALDCRHRRSGCTDWHELEVGDVYFKWNDGTSTGEGCAHGVEILTSDLEAMDLPVSEGELLTPAPASGRLPERKGGRPPANWWPAFAEELAVHIYESGLPEGSGGDGQTKVCDAVYGALSVKGINITESTVEPVIANVLKRLRSSEN